MSPTPSAGERPLLVVGLGNPGPRYADHRHNVGAMVLQELLAECGGGLRRHKAAQALVAEVRLGEGGGGLPGPRAVLAQPTTYMNDAGGPVVGLAKFYSLRPADVVVLHDDLELPFGEVRLKVGGGEGGHNGLRSVSKALKTRDYGRIRVGIGRPPGRMEVADYVLKPFSTAERRDLPFVAQEAVRAVNELASARGGPAP